MVVIWVLDIEMDMDIEMDLGPKWISKWIWERNEYGYGDEHGYQDEYEFLYFNLVRPYFHWV